MKPPNTLRCTCPLCGEIMLVPGGPTIVRRYLPCEKCWGQPDFDEKMKALPLRMFIEVMQSLAEIESIQRDPIVKADAEKKLREGALDGMQIIKPEHN